MLCVARVNLSDWPEGQIREVDPTNETIAGFLRTHYIVPVRVPRRSGAQAAASGDDEPVVEDAPEEAAGSREKAAQSRKGTAGTGDE